MQRWLLVAVALALAGCSEATQVPDGIPVNEDGKALPNLEGFVVDESIRPMAGVLVRILFSDVNATTDDEGHYAIDRPTRMAEDVLLSASFPGYQSRTQQVQVSGYRSTRLDFRLELDPYMQPHMEILKETDNFECQARTGLAPGTHSCGVPQPIQTGDPPPPPNVWVINPTPGFAGIIVEVYWNAATPLSNTLHVVLRAPVAGGFAGDLGDIQAEATGSSPVRLEIPAEVAQEFTHWTAVHVEVSLPESQGSAPLSFARAQTYDMYASLFYVDPAPPGYTLG